MTNVFEIWHQLQGAVMLNCNGIPCLLLLQILETYKHGVAAFKETISSNGLTVDAIDDTMADVQEASTIYINFLICPI